MILASWNVNSITARLPHVLEWLQVNAPDILLLQELKTTEDKFPFKELEALGYDCAVHGQKTWNGVAILSRHKIEDVKKGLYAEDEQARYIEATVQGVRVASVYLPNGNPVESEKYPYKLEWMDRLRTRAQELLQTDMPVALGGDFNIIPADDDCHDPTKWADDALFRPESRKKFRALLHLGLTDAFRVHHHEAHQYTYWDYQAGAWPKNNGIRIDHFLLSPRAVDLLESSRIDKEPRGKEKASDHTPIVITLGRPHTLHHLD